MAVVKCCPDSSFHGYHHTFSPTTHKYPVKLLMPTFEFFAVAHSETNSGQGCSVTGDRKAASGVRPPTRRRSPPQRPIRAYA